MFSNCSNCQESHGKKGLKAVLFFFAFILFSALLWNGLQFGGAHPDSDLYQVVLLNNDQAFYGKLHNINSEYPYLTDVYYLKNQQPEKDKDGHQIGGDKFTVIKRGIDEIHQPTDTLYINAKNLLYWENVGSDSLVARGIKADKEYRANQTKTEQNSQDFKNETLKLNQNTK